MCRVRNRGVKDLEQNREGRMSAKDSEQGRDVKDLEQNREVRMSVKGLE